MSFSVVSQLLKAEEDSSYKPTRKACVQLVDSLVDFILRYEESLSGNRGKPRSVYPHYPCVSCLSCGCPLSFINAVQSGIVQG